MRVAVRADAGPLIGGGHAMRCMTLADALAGRGAEIMFVSATMSEPISERISASGYELRRVPTSAGLEREGGDWHEPPLDPEAQMADARATADACGSVDWLVADHYLLDASWHSVARSFAGRILVIDDLANRSYDCDLLVDETGGRTPADYEGLIPATAVALVGARYALLRPEFPSQRPAALERRRQPQRPARILISFGTTDPGAISASAVDAARSSAPGCEIDVVVAEGAPSLPQLREISGKQSGVTLHVNSERMAELMRDADLAIGAAGTTSWERCCLGLPAIALVLAENQRRNAEALERAGAAVRLESADEIGAAIAGLLSDEKLLHRMGAAASGLTDGRGTSRVVEAMLGACSEPAAVRA